MIGLFGQLTADHLRAMPLVCDMGTYQWHQAWREARAEVLVPQGPGGQGCKLSVRCQEKPAAYLEQGPAAHGAGSQDQIWTGARVATLIGRKFYVTYSVWGATRLMHQLGFTP